MRIGKRTTYVNMRGRDSVVADFAVKKSVFIVLDIIRRTHDHQVISRALPEAPLHSFGLQIQEEFLDLVAF